MGAEALNDHLSYTVSNQILQMLINDSGSMDNSKCASIIALENVQQGFDLSCLNNLDFSMLSQLAQVLLQHIKITVDIGSLSPLIDDMLQNSRKQSVIDGLIKAQAPLPLMKSLFNMPQYLFTKMRIASGIDSRGGHPKALGLKECRAVQDAWNTYIKRLMAEEAYKKGEEEFLIGETILSIHLETKLPITNIYPLLDNKCSLHVSLVNFETTGYPFVKQVEATSKRGTSSILFPRQEYLKRGVN